MRPWRELVLGVLAALVSTILLGGSLLVAITEDQTFLARAASPSPTVVFTLTATLSPTPLPTAKQESPRIPPP